MNFLEKKIFFNSLNVGDFIKVKILNTDRSGLKQKDMKFSVAESCGEIIFISAKFLTYRFRNNSGLYVKESITFADFSTGEVVLEKV